MGTSGVRAGIVRADGSVTDLAYEPLRVTSPSLGLVELDAVELARSVLDVARQALAAGGPVQAVGVTNQRGSAVCWHAETGEPLGPGIGWQDLRTAGTCLALQAEGFRLTPSESATKLAWLLDTFDPERGLDLRFGTIDTWVIWQLTGGRTHITDLSNAAVTGLLRTDGSGWNTEVLERLRIPDRLLPELVDSSGLLAEASELVGLPPLTGIAGDQQASLIGQCALQPGLAKVTFGTGAMLDLFVGRQRPDFEYRAKRGCFPVVAWRRQGEIAWGVEAIMLGAGAALDWLRDDLGVLGSPDESDRLAASVPDSGGLVVVPAPLGLGTPYWDFGARTTIFGVTRGAGRAHLVRATLEGVAQRGADLLEAAEADSGLAITSLRVDGGMSANQSFLQALANACARPIEISPQLEATTLGAGYLAGLAVGMWTDEELLTDGWHPRAVIEPNGPSGRDRWRDAIARSERWIPELSDLHF